MAFKKANGSPSRQVILLIEGPESSRKTTLGLQCPGPLGVLDLNKGLDIPEFYVEQKKKEIAVSSIHVPRGEGIQQEAEEQWKIFMADVLKSLEENPWTFVDTASNVWELCRLAMMGALTVRDLDKALQKRGQLNFDAPNAAMRQWLFYPYETGNNLIVTAHQSTWEGVTTQRGFKEIPEIVRQHVVVTKDWDCTILKCRSNSKAIGKTLKNPTFLDLLMVFFPSADPEDFYPTQKKGKK